MALTKDIVTSMQGLASDRPATANTGDTFYATDTGIWSVWDLVAGGWASLPGKPAIISSTVTTFANSVAENTLNSVSLAANFFGVGRAVHITARGVYGTRLAGATTLTLKVELDAVIVGNSGAISATLNLANQGWILDFLIVGVTTGAGGTVEGQGYAALATAIGTAAIAEIQNTATVAVDTTASHSLKLTETWSAADPANTITIRQFIVEVLG